MWERVKSLTDLSGAQNPHYASSVTWEPQVALDRAKAYYRQRLANEKPLGEGPENRQILLHERCSSLMRAKKSSGHI